MKTLPSLLLTGSLGLLAGCATVSDKTDPLECYNRYAFKFNHGVDLVIGRPVADLYDTLIPTPIQMGVTRAFYNFYEPTHVANDLLQGNLCFAAKDTARFIINSTVGLAGFFDVAHYLNLNPHAQDLGITFARWGWQDSSYFVVPFFGVYTIRDAVAAPINLFFSFYPYIEPESLGWQIYAVDKIHYRAAIRPADKVIDEAFDPYVFVRDAYLQHRRHEINGDEDNVTSPNVVFENKAAAQSANLKQKSKTNRSAKSTADKNLPDIIS